MLEQLTTLGLAMLFGLGVSLCLLSASLFYTVYIKADSYDSPLLITVIACVSMWMGSSFISFVYLMAQRNSFNLPRIQYGCMEPNKAAEYVKTDPRRSSEEKEFSVNFTKECDRASVFTSISSQVKRLLTHTDVEVKRVTAHYSDDDEWERTELENVEPRDDLIICAMWGKVPIESLKIQSSPRSQRSYANIISNQGEVNIE